MSNVVTGAVMIGGLKLRFTLGKLAELQSRFGLEPNDFTGLLRKLATIDPYVLGQALEVGAGATREQIEGLDVTPFEIGRAIASALNLCLFGVERLEEPPLVEVPNPSGIGIQFADEPQGLELPEASSQN